MSKIGGRTSTLSTIQHSKVVGYGSRDLFKSACAHTHHDLTDFEVQGMLEMQKMNISRTEHDFV